MALASTYFYNSNDPDKQTLHRRIRPSDSQFEEQQDRWNSLKEFLLPKLEARSGYELKSWLQGSYKFGTQIRPVRQGGEFDIDLGVYYCWARDTGDGTRSPKVLKSYVQDSLREFARLNQDVDHVADPPKLRCCRIHFEGTFHIDVPCYHLDPDADERELATERDQWEQSDPKALYQWFTSTFDDVTRERVRRLIQYTKAWAALKLSNLAEPPSSVLLTVLVSNTIVDNRALVQGPEDEVFAATIDALCDTVSSNQEVLNPVDNTENLAVRMTPESWRAFSNALLDLQKVAESALQCETDFAACSTWAGAFEHLFPLPETDRIDEEARNLPALRTLPEVRVTAVSNDNSAFTYTGVNRIGPIRKNCKIAFRVTNVANFPVSTQFAWMVRNEGTEAEDVNDLGHNAGRGISASERSAYNGTHYMDCVAVVSDRIISVRRVKVVIHGEAAPRRNPIKKPNYVSIRGRK